MGSVYLVRSSSGEPFAVKKITNVSNDQDRFNFLREIWTWIDLPDHPNIVAGRFVRAIRDETAIFAEYVNGNSLKKWIDEGSLTRLEDLLDVAIQFAWGLHAAHTTGLVHQDVKPANALLTLDREVKVSDFGLARVRSIISHTGSPAASAHQPLLD
jgi:serine/threonine protein kinase